MYLTTFHNAGRGKKRGGAPVGAGVGVGAPGSGAPLGGGVGAPTGGGRGAFGPGRGGGKRVLNARRILNTGLGAWKGLQSSKGGGFLKSAAAVIDGGMRGYRQRLTKGKQARPR